MLRPDFLDTALISNSTGSELNQSDDPAAQRLRQIFCSLAIQSRNPQPIGSCDPQAPAYSRSADSSPLIHAQDKKTFSSSCLALPLAGTPSSWHAPRKAPSTVISLRRVSSSMASPNLVSARSRVQSMPPIISRVPLPLSEQPSAPSTIFSNLGSSLPFLSMRTSTPRCISRVPLPFGSIPSLSRLEEYHGMQRSRQDNPVDSGDFLTWDTRQQSKQFKAGSASALSLPYVSSDASLTGRASPESDLESDCGSPSVVPGMSIT